MKITGFVPSDVRVTDLCAALRDVGLVLRYRDGMLVISQAETPPRRPASDVVPLRIDKQARRQ